MYSSTDGGVDTAAVAGLQEAVGVERLRTVCLNKFVQDGYARNQETKLRSRKQGIDELTQEYFYEVLNLCRKVHPAMTEAAKLNYLFRGLKLT